MIVSNYRRRIVTTSNIIRSALSSYKEEFAISNIYKVPDAKSFPHYRKVWSSINYVLKSSGITAPSDVSLANVAMLYEKLGRPLDNTPILHVGGTNGKGSTSWKLAKSFQALGMRTGLFVSPHIVTCRERMQVDFNLVSEEDFMELMDTIFSLCIKHHIFATQFEVTFLMSVLYFSKQQCDVIVYEVGMGGEYDATNVLQTTASVICSVGLDHTKALGNTIDLIATKKLGIIKDNGLVLIGPTVPYDIAQAMAMKQHATLYSFDTTWTAYAPILQAYGLTSAQSPLPPNEVSKKFNPDTLNTALALLLLCLLSQHQSFNHQLMMLQTLQQHLSVLLFTKQSSQSLYNAIWSRPPCRWEVHSLPYCCPSHHDRQQQQKQQVVEMVLDMGHNPPAIQSLLERIEQTYPVDQYIVHIIFGMSRDKDVHRCLQLVGQSIPSHRIHFVQSDYYRALSTTQLQQTLAEQRRIMGEDSIQQEQQGRQKTTRDTIEHAVQCCLGEAVEQSGKKAVVVVCGTGYIMADARAFVGIEERRDDSE